jgi:hypothetical protein
MMVDPMAAPADIELPDVATPIPDDDDDDVPSLADIPDSDDNPEQEEENELFVASPTLCCFNADDVALDMDIDEWDLDQQEDDSNYEGSEDESDDDE